MDKDDNDIYNWCYPIICLYKEVHFGLIGDAGHKQRLLSDLATADPFSKLDTRMTLGRCCAFHDKHTTYRPHRCVFLMIMTSYGIRKKWWKSFADSPLCKVVRDGCGGGGGRRPRLA